LQPLDSHCFALRRFQLVASSMLPNMKDRIDEVRKISIFNAVVFSTYRKFNRKAGETPCKHNSV
jgi:hypothetical protein